MKIIKKIIWGLLTICFLCFITLAGAHGLGYINGKADCPPPPCTEESAAPSTYS